MAARCLSRSALEPYAYRLPLMTKAVITRRKNLFMCKYFMAETKINKNNEYPYTWHPYQT